MAGTKMVRAVCPLESGKMRGSPSRPLSFWTKEVEWIRRELDYGKAEPHPHFFRRH